MAGHPAIAVGRAAVITGGASGIGLAAALKLVGLGMKVCVADLPGAALDTARAELARLSPDTLAVAVDVRESADIERLKREAYAAFGEVALLMNNAGTGPGGGPYDHPDRWRRVLEVNLFGVIHGVQAFTPAMLAQGTPCAIVNTGSKQGITCPPGDTAYNVSKAGLKVLTEGLAHALRNEPGGHISAHLLVPGSTFTGLTAQGITEKPPGMWSAAQVVDFMLDGMAAGDFYILCPDNEVTRAVDNKRIQWAADDLIRNRPPLSRWHPDHADAFREYLAG